MGQTGTKGPIGEKGDTGPQGPKGDTGLIGEKGDTGIADFSPLKSFSLYCPSDSDFCSLPLGKKIKTSNLDIGEYQELLWSTTISGGGAVFEGVKFKLVKIGKTVILTQTDLEGMGGFGNPKTFTSNANELVSQDSLPASFIPSSNIKIAVSRLYIFQDNILHKTYVQITTDGKIRISTEKPFISGNSITWEMFTLTYNTPF